MGIQGLQSLMNKGSRQGQRFEWTPHDKGPCVVVDGMGLVYMLFRKECDWMLGGNWHHFEARLLYYLCTLRAVTENVIVVLDGAVTALKRDTVLKRAEEKIALASHILSEEPEKILLRDSAPCFSYVGGSNASAGSPTTVLSMTAAAMDSTPPVTDDAFTPVANIADTYSSKCKCSFTGIHCNFLEFSSKAAPPLQPNIRSSVASKCGGNVILPPCTNEIVIQILANHGFNFVVCAGDADGAAAALSLQHHAVVLAQDSDYFMLNLFAYAPFESLFFDSDSKVVVGIFFRPTDTAACLNAPVSHLPLIAALCRNDFTQDKLDDFYSSLAIWLSRGGGTNHISGSDYDSGGGGESNIKKEGNKKGKGGGGKKQKSRNQSAKKAHKSLSNNVINNVKAFVAAHVSPDSGTLTDTVLAMMKIPPSAPKYSTLRIWLHRVFALYENREEEGIQMPAFAHTLPRLMDVFVTRTYYCFPILEDLAYPSAWTFSLPLIEVLCALALGPCSQSTPCTPVSIYSPSDRTLTKGSFQCGAHGCAKGLSRIFYTYPRQALLRLLTCKMYRRGRKESRMAETENDNIIDKGLHDDQQEEVDREKQSPGDCDANLADGDQWDHLPENMVLPLATLKFLMAKEAVSNEVARAILKIITCCCCHSDHPCSCHCPYPRRLACSLSKKQAESAGAESIITYDDVSTDTHEGDRTHEVTANMLKPKEDSNVNKHTRASAHMHDRSEACPSYAFVAASGQVSHNNLSTVAEARISTSTRSTMAYASVVAESTATAEPMLRSTLSFPRSDVPLSPTPICISSCVCTPLQTLPFLLPNDLLIATQSSSLAWLCAVYVVHELNEVLSRPFPCIALTTLCDGARLHSAVRFSNSFHCCKECEAFQRSCLDLVSA